MKFIIFQLVVVTVCQDQTFKFDRGYQRENQVGPVGRGFSESELGFGFGNAFNYRQETTTQASPQNPCTLPKYSGPCQALIFRWYYNAGTKTCEEFAFGGCGANKNNFHSQHECLLACSGYSSRT